MILNVKPTNDMTSDRHDYQNRMLKFTYGNLASKSILFAIEILAVC